MNIGELVNLSNKLDKLRYGISFAVHHTSPVCYGRERIRSSYGRRSARSPRCPGSPFLDMLWVNPFSVSVLTYAACWCCQPMSSTAWAASPRATPAWQPPTRPCASTTRVFGHLPDDQRSSGVCWAGACALPNVSAAPFTLFAMANGLVFAGGSDRLERGGATGMSGLPPDEDGLAGIGAGLPWAICGRAFTSPKHGACTLNS